jgi:hypothetical protein
MDEQQQREAQAPGFSISGTSSRFVGFLLSLAAEDFARWREQCRSSEIDYTEMEIRCDDRRITMSYEEFVRRVFAEEVMHVRV